MENVRYPTTAFAKELLNKYIPANKNNRKGLFLLPLQTGSGKTHATIQYMKEHIEKNRKGIIIYAVNTIHNVEDTYNKLIKILRDENRNEVLFLKNNYDSIIDAFENEGGIDKFKNLGALEEFRSLKSSIQTIFKNRELKFDENYKKTVESQNSNLKKTLMSLNKKKSISNDMTKEINLLYPTNSLSRYRIVFMTTSKLYYPIFTLKGNTPVYRDKAFKGTVLFLDEFDIQKTVFLDHIIKDKVRNSYEFIELFVRITATLQNKKFAKKYNINADTFEAICKRNKMIFAKYHMQYGFQYGFREEKDNSTILMNSTLSSVIQGQNKTNKIDISKNKSTHINYINSDGELPFLGMLKDIDRELRAFNGFLRSIVRSEVNQTRKKVNQPSVNTETEQEAIERIIYDLIKELGYTRGDNHYNYLEDVLKHGIYSKSSYFKSPRDEFYENGFKIINITQHTEQSKTNDFHFFELTNTPEKFMNELCQDFFVVGISATATIETLMRNFDLKYLKSKVKYKTLSSEEIKKASKLYIESKKQKNRNTHIEYISVDSAITETIKKYFGSKMNMLDYLTEIHHKDHYNYHRLIRIVHVYKEFLIHDEMETLLAFMSAMVEDTKEVLNPENIARLIFEMMCENFSEFNEKTQTKIKTLKTQEKELGEKKFVEMLINKNRLFYIYNSKKDNPKNYENMFNKQIENKEKVFVLSAYQTIGIGANLEYKSPLEDKVKDYDGIFIDAPTSFTQRNFNGKTPREAQEKRVKAIFQLESLNNRGYFTNNEYVQYARSILNEKNSGMKYNDMTDYVNSVMSTIIQAIGRLYRAEADKTKMFIYLSDNIAQTVANFDASSQILLPSVQKLIEFTYEQGVVRQENEKEKQAINMFKLNNSFLRQKIFYMLSVFDAQKTDGIVVKEWEDYRKFLIENPTISDDIIKYQWCYGNIPLPNNSRSYFYTQEDDYKNIEIFFQKQNSAIEVSESSAMLDVISNTEELAQCVKENKICLKFEHNYIMTPIAFNNLYKGALGETIGKYLIEQFCDTPLFLLDINKGDEYERFDYRTEDGSCYFDFKYYSQHTLEITNRKSIMEKAKLKLEDTQKAIIVNIFADVDEYKNRGCFIDGDIMLVPFLIDYRDRLNPKLEHQMFNKIRKFIG